MENNKNIFIGRQPILDSKQRVIAYELLFRSSEVNSFDGIDGNQATAQVLNNSIMEFDLDDVVGNNLAFINFTKELLLSDTAELLPANRVVIEILETVDVDEAVISKVKKLVEAGYTIALDDFTYSDAWQPLIDLAHIIKFDLSLHDFEEIQSQLTRFNTGKLKLLAEKIETQEDYKKFKESGFDYFQGYFFSKPEVISHKALTEASISLLQLLSEIQKPDVEPEQLEKLISQDVSLSYKLFRCVNSAAFGLKNKMNSIKQAVVYLGIQRLKNWISLLAMTGNPNKSTELIQIGLVRAKMCELIANERDLPEKDSFFIVGLFSILDAVLDKSLEEILKTMPLDEALNLALLERGGDMGAALECSIHCEQCHVDSINFPGIDKERLYNIYSDAMAWSRESLNEIN